MHPPKKSKKTSKVRRRQSQRKQVQRRPQLNVKKKQLRFYTRRSGLEIRPSTALKFLTLHSEAQHGRR